MLTILGKILVYVATLLSLLALGFAFWLLVERRDWGKRGEVGTELQALKKEIDQRYEAMRREDAVRQGLVKEMVEENRSLVWSFQTVAGDDNKQIAVPGQRLTVRQAREEEAKLKEIVKKLADDAQVRQVKFGTARDDLRKARDETLAEQKRTEEINKLHTGLGDTAKQYAEAKQAAEAEQQRIEPEISNEDVRVFLLRKRNAQLDMRLKRLEGLP